MAASVVVLLATAWSCCAWAATIPFACPAGLDAVRGAPAHTESDHALACTDVQGRQQGPYQEEFSDGSVATSGRYKDGKPDGTWAWPGSSAPPAPAARRRESPQPRPVTTPPDRAAVKLMVGTAAR